MAYSQIKTPRFYVDHIQFLKAMNFDFISHYNDTYFTEDGEGLGYSEDNEQISTYLSLHDFFTL